MSSQPLDKLSAQYETTLNLSTKTPTLDTLPEELIVKIVKSNPIDKEALRNLVLTSRKLCRICMKYLDSRFKLFYNALKVADLDAIKRYATYGVTPVNYNIKTKSARLYDFQVMARKMCDMMHRVHNRIHESPNSLETSAPQAPIQFQYFCSPLFVLCSSFREYYKNTTESSPLPVKKWYETLKWLLDHGAEPTSKRRGQTPLHELLSLMLTRVWDREDSDILHRMVYLLIDRGAALPRLIEVKDISWCCEKFIQYNYGQTQMIELCLRMTIDESLLEKWLAGLKEEGFCLTDRGDSIPADLSLDKDVVWTCDDAYDKVESRRTLLTWSRSVHIESILMPMCGFLIDPNYSWQEKHKGEAIQMFFRKIDILVKYRAIDDKEERALRQLAITAKEIYEERCSNPSQSILDPVDSLHRISSSIIDSSNAFRKSVLDDPDRYQRFRTDDNWSPVRDLILWIWWKECNGDNKLFSYRYNFSIQGQRRKYACIEEDLSETPEQWIYAIGPVILSLRPFYHMTSSQNIYTNFLIIAGQKTELTYPTGTPSSG